MRKDRIKEMSLEIMVGAFMFVVLLALGWLTIVLSRENFFAETYPLQVIFEEVQGLRDGDNVLTRGVAVGRVKSLEVRENGVHIFASLDQEIIFKEDYQIEIVASSILGGQHMSIYAGSPNAKPLAKDDILRGQKPLDLVDEASEAMAALREAFVDGGVLENLKSTMEQVNSLTARMEDGEGTIGKLMVEDGVYNDIVEITENLKNVSARMDEGKGMLGKMLSEDDQMYTDLSEGIAAFKDLTVSMGNGEGTLGKLAKDEELYNEARLLMKELRAAIDDMQETAPITTFSSVFFGAF